jgi:hypothetical protein
MSKKDLTDEGIKAAILNKLKNRGCWGARYIPLDSIAHWIAQKIKRNGKRVQEAVKQLIAEQYLIPHKKGATISLNPAKNNEILEIIRRNVPWPINP